jgi:hypothetical protein
MNYEGSTTLKQGGKKTLDFLRDCAVNPLIGPFVRTSYRTKAARKITLREKDVRY